MCGLVKVCRLEELPEDTPQHFEYGGKHYVLIRRSDEVFVLDGICTHEYAELWRGFVVGDVLTCPLHLSQFDIRTGQVITPPAEQPLRTYRAEVRDGEVWVDFD